jgi:3-isopropylmalate/(R)-2-methylmalate dehydratase small subunit
MEPVTVVSGTMLPLWRADVDTDQIMPKQHLKRIERTGFGEFVFDDWRQDPDFVMNKPEHQGANVLVAGPNFGCGSSREHAPWGLQQYGFDAIVAPSFADIFKSNSAKIGLLTVTLPRDDCKRLVDLATDEPAIPIRIDLPDQTVVSGDVHLRFEIEPHTKHMLVNGLDPIGLTLTHAADIAAFESTRPSWLPTTTAPN